MLEMDGNVSLQTKPTQEEENDLFLTTGFRYLPASERGFPYPWCAKKSKKGWIIRDCPPAPMQYPDTGVEFIGWKVAEKMYRGRELLLERVRNTVDQEHRQSSTNGTIESRSNGSNGALKRRAAKKSNVHYVMGRNVVSHWFRHTQEAVRIKNIHAREEEFQSFLRKKKKELILQMKQKLQNNTQDEQKGAGTVVDLHQKIQQGGSASASVNKIPDADQVPMSPLRRKHKKIIPKRNQQFSNSIILGEDPELDQMIEDIVLEFTNDCTHLNNNASGVEFDGSAVSALREAAKDTLNSMTNQGHHVDNSRIVTKKTTYTAIVSESSSDKYSDTADGKKNL
jgi:hypothetical protein